MTEYQQILLLLQLNLKYNKIENAMHILIVEDEHGIIQFLKQGLEEEGYTVTSATDGAKGFELIQMTSFDLIL